MNDVPASGSLAAFETAHFYYAWQLKDHPEIRRPYAFAVGHFGWELPSRVSDRRWRIVTALREPLEHLLSLFDYLRQHGRLESQVGAQPRQSLTAAMTSSWWPGCISG